MDQDRRDAAAWAKEWQIRNKNRRIIALIAGIALAALIVYAIYIITIHAERSIYGSEEEMRAALQGRYAIERSYEDIIIEGDVITHTFLAYSHYDREYAENYGYDHDDKDYVYEDRAVKWDYRHGVIKTEWMGNIIVDKNGNIRFDDSYYFVYYKTDAARPDPIDPSTLNSTDGGTDASGDALTGEDQDLEQRNESLEATQAAAMGAGIEPKSPDTDD